MKDFSIADIKEMITDDSDYKIELGFNHKGIDIEVYTTNDQHVIQESESKFFEWELIELMDCDIYDLVDFVKNIVERKEEDI